MPEYLAPGVYVEEIDTGNKPIEGVSTSTAGMLGVSERGPVNVPILVTSYGEYTRWFGERLRIQDFSNGNGAHCYLPHSMEGFFLNGGKRAYVTRVLETNGPEPASLQLFDRGTATSADTVLLRAASEETGTEAALPRLYVLNTTQLSHNTWIRIGDGSSAEYRQVDVVEPVASNTHVALDSPLSRSHDSGKTVEEFARAATAGYTGPITLVTPVDPSTGQHMPLPQGAQAIVVNSATAADITTLVGAGNVLIEIGAAPAREFRFVVLATQTANDQATLNLDSPLTLAYRHGDHVTPLAINPLALAPAPPQRPLDTAATAGDAIVFVNNRGANFILPTHLVVIDRADAAQREVRKIGALALATIAPGAYEDYPADSLVEKVALSDDTRHLTAAVAAGANKVTLDDVTSLVVGQQVLVGPVLSPEAMVIQSIAPGAALQGTVTFTGSLANAHPSGDLFRPAPKSLVTVVNPGQNVLALDDRLGLSENDLLRIDVGGNHEYAQIQTIPNRAPGAAAPDAGNVILTYPLALSHATGTRIWRDASTAPAAPIPPTVAALEVQPGATALLLTESGYAAGDTVRITSPTGAIFLHELSAVGAVANASEVSVQAPPLERGHSVAALLVGRDPLIEVDAIDSGAWGNRLRISIVDEAPGLVSRTQLATIINPTHIRLASAAGVEAGTVLELLDPLNSDAVVDMPLKVASVDRTTNYTITLAAGLSAAQQAAQANAILHSTRLGVRSREFRLLVSLLHQSDPAIPIRGEAVLDSEGFRNLSMDSRHSRYFQTIIGDINGPLRLIDRRPEGQSWYVRVHDLAQDLAEPARTNTLEGIRLGPETLVDLLPSGRTRPARQALENGDDSVITLSDDTYIGADNVDPELRTGLYTFVNVGEISLVSVPGRASAVIQGAVIDHCEMMRYRFAVLDAQPPPKDSLADVQFQRQQFDTKYAALYHPWLLIEDPFPTNLTNISNYSIPPSGHVLGIYARTDIERGVHKAPANEVVLGILGLQRILNKQEQEILNPSPVNINVIRDFRTDNRSIRVWGGRVITSDTDWKYVNVRRLLIFIEKSIDQGLQWVVFEPNADPLWARVRRTIGNFLTTVWRNGGLEGTKPEEAYFVKCDRTTMTQDDIDNGRLIVVIGVAPVKPAEFVIIRIGLWTANAQS